MKDNLNSHYFHAEAHALTAKLNLPFEAQLRKQAFVKLEGDSQKVLLEGDELKKLKDKKTPDNYFSEHPRPYRFEGLFSYSAAHTQVSGHRSNKTAGAFVTLATSVVENLNVMNVVTADKVVAQISTTHLPDQYSPKVTFLGTHFENLRIAHHKATPALNLNFVGDPQNREKAKAKDNNYLTTLTESIKRNYDAFLSKIEGKHVERLQADDSWPSAQYHRCSDFDYEAILAEAAAKDKEAKAPVSNGAKWKGVTCSLVEHVDIEDIVVPVKLGDPKQKDPEPIVIHPPAHCLGHVIHVKDFGTIFLAELKVNHNSFHLTMIRLELGCIADGSASIASCNVNGKGGKGGGTTP
ncbi:MAG TPA: hypothetical protein VJP02_01725 [Candidatus Sulfotelmatobacter sp.]|nr:hypothetical protein [Candidatus Sulfotelmatobacter sp.]